MVTLPRVDRAAPVRLVPVAHLRALHRLLIVLIGLQLLNLSLDLFRLFR